MNNVELCPITEEVSRPDSEIDFPKPLSFTETWHNKNDFFCHITKDRTKAKKSESCKVEFARGGVVCIPQDISILHKERYHYPKKDTRGKVTMVPTWSREASKFYCVKKDYILRRHPYFWKGLLKIEDDVRLNLKEGHVKLLREALHLSV